MRFIAANALLPGYVLGRDILFDKDRVFLRQGAVLTPPQIERIHRMGFQGVYVLDELSRNIPMQNIISEALRQKTLALVRTCFAKIEQDTRHKSQKALLELLPAIEDMIQEIAENQKRMLPITDICCFDDYNYTHSVNVAVLSILLGLTLGMNQHALIGLALGAFALDIGKLFIDKRIINNQGKLVLDEFEEIRRHCIAGYNYLSACSAIPDLCRAAVLSHHEQFNGTGYPAGLSGEAIPLPGRIVCVADVYDALVSSRPFRAAMLPSDAVEYIMSGYGTSFDPMVVDAFIRRVAPYPAGICVRLSNNMIGIVIENYESACLRPKLRILENGQLTAQYLDLAKDFAASTITIVGVAEL